MVDHRYVEKNFGIPKYLRAAFAERQLGGVRPTQSHDVPTRRCRNATSSHAGFVVNLNALDKAKLTMTYGRRE
jgi:hypothetical protein